jgi:hypothetical protein
MRCSGAARFLRRPVSSKVRLGLEYDLLLYFSIPNQNSSDHRASRSHERGLECQAIAKKLKKP